MIFKRKLIQAPLAGYSCAPFRELAWRYGKPDFCCSEMLSAKHIYSGAKQKKRYTYKSPKEGPLCIQLAGNQIDELACAAEKAASWGAQYLDLNCGCPQPKIRKKGIGSKLLADSAHLKKLITAMREHSGLPVFVKIRVDGDSGEQFNQAIAQAVEEAGATALTVHGRHWTERYDQAVRYDEIAAIKQAVSIPVIGNGDIEDTASAKRMLEQTGVDALMIARASVGQPWLFEQIHQELHGNTFTPPSLTERGKLFLEHVQGLIELDTELPAVLQARKLGKYYARQQTTPELIAQLNTANQFIDLIDIVENHF
jgi:tRNA-dihydrouridine synthase B